MKYFSKENKVILQYQVWKLFMKKGIEPPQRLLPPLIIEGSTAEQLYKIRLATVMMEKSLKEKNIGVKDGS